MPQFNTGTSWDQGLNALGSMLFPDPSRIAQAGLMGAQQRNQRIQGDTAIDQQRHLHELGGYPVGDNGMETGPAVARPPVYYSQPGPRLPGLDIPPGPWPGQKGVGTGVATGMPVVSGQAPAVSGQGPAAPQGPLASDAFIPPGQVQTGPVAPIQGAGLNPTLMEASAPPPPMPVAPPANDTRTEGGRIMSQPAAQDGSPAPPMDLAQIFVQAKLAGMSDPEAVNYAAGKIIDMQQHGQIDPNTSSQAQAAVGRTGMLQAQTSIATQALASGAQQQESARQFDLGMKPVIDDTDTVRAIPNKMWAEDPLKWRYIDPQAAGQYTTLNSGTVNVHPKGADGRPDLTRSIMVPKRVAVRDGLQPTKPDWSPIGTNTAGAEEGAFQRDALLKGIVEREYQADPLKPGFDYSREEPGEFTEQALNALRDRTNTVLRKDPKFQGDQKNYGAAAGVALRQLQHERILPTRQETQDRRKRGWWDDKLGMLPTAGIDQDLMKGTDAEGYGRKSFRVDLLNPYKPDPENKAPPKPPGPNLGGEVFAQPGSVGGTGGAQPTPREGDVGTDPQGRLTKIQNGVPVPLSAQDAERYKAWLAAQPAGAR